MRTKLQRRPQNIGDVRTMSIHQRELELRNRANLTSREKLDAVGVPAEGIWLSLMFAAQMTIPDALPGDTGFGVDPARVWFCTGKIVLSQIFPLKIRMFTLKIRMYQYVLLSIRSIKYSFYCVGVHSEKTLPQ